MFVAVHMAGGDLIFEDLLPWALVDLSLEHYRQLSSEQQRDAWEAEPNLPVVEAVCPRRDKSYL